MAKAPQIIVGLDIGTTKVCCVIGEVNEQGEVDVIGIGQHPSLGLRKGVVVNIKTTVESIKTAVEEAEMMAGVEVDSAYVGIAGGHIRGGNTQGVIAVKGKEITQRDIDRVIETATTHAVSIDREVIHVLPQEFIVDGQDGIRSPLGLYGTKLEVKVHTVTGAVTSAQNIVTCVNRAGFQVNDIVLQPLASAEAVLTDEEREHGVCLVDIGGGTSDTIIYVKNAIQFTSSLGIGGIQVTNDIAVGLKTTMSSAEKIKREHGCALSGLVRKGETLEVPGLGGREPKTLSRKILSDIIEPRVEELFGLLKGEMDAVHYKEVLFSGVVITGGTAIMEGMEEAAERAYKLPIRRGFPKGVGGLADEVNSPMFATGVGLLLYGLKQGKKNEREPKTLSGRNLFNKTLTRMKGWITDLETL